jgi:hypothetical protein
LFKSLVTCLARRSSSSSSDSLSIHTSLVLFFLGLSDSDAFALLFYSSPVS